MKTTRLLSTAGAALSAALLIALAPSAQALSTPDFDYTVTLNVASLSSNPNQPFSLDLQLVQGSGNVTNTVHVYNFSTTGTASGFTGTSYNNGSETGSIAPGGSVVLTNSQSDNELAATFAAGTQTISFNVDETPNTEVVGSGTPIPDQFNIAILDSGLNNIPTTDPSGGNTLLTSALGEEPNVTTFSSLTPDGGVIVTEAVPEPSSTALSFIAAGGLLGLVLLRRRYTT